MDFRLADGFDDNGGQAMTKAVVFPLNQGLETADWVSSGGLGGDHCVTIYGAEKITAKTR